MMQSEPELPPFKWKRPQGGTNQRRREFNRRRQQPRDFIWPKKNIGYRRDHAWFTQGHNPRCLWESQLKIMICMCVCVCVCVCFSRSVMSDLCDPMDCSPRGSCPWDSHGENSGVGCHSLFRGPSQWEIEPRSPVLYADSLLSEPLRKQKSWYPCIILRKILIFQCDICLILSPYISVHINWSIEKYFT